MVRHPTQRRRPGAGPATLVTTLALLAAGAGAAGASPEGATSSTVNTLNLNEIQVVGTHNSYHRELLGAERAAYDALVQTPGDYERSLAYSHASLPLQLADQQVRGLELDLFPDPQGGLYREPGVRRVLGLGPLQDPAWDEPGIKTFHIADLDYTTTCVLFTSCLTQIEAWSEGHPHHVPLMVMLELKGSDERAVAAGGVQAPPWDDAQLDRLDQEIRSVFDADDLVTPDDVRLPGRTLEESALGGGWPSLDESRGKVMFLLDNEGPLNDLYAWGRPSLEGRVLFTNGTPGEADAAFVKRNDPVADGAAISALVEAGYLVRTRSDVPLEQARTGDTTMLEAALRSGAQLISTDFPVVGMTARYGSDYVARLPGGGVARCNPVNSPVDCADEQLEPSPFEDQRA